MTDKIKAIIIGPPLVGKTTIVNYLRSKTSLQVLELDEELVKLNNGVWPSDEEHRNKVLVHKVVDEVKNMDNVIFFTTYFGVEDLRRVKEGGFKVLQLMLEKDELLKRNITRMQGRESDATKDVENNLRLQDDIKKAGVIDKTIFTNKPVAEVVSEILAYLTVKK
jgi:adenylate kinase family enzyme